MMWNEYNRSIQHNLEQLRTDSFKIMALATGIIAWIWFSWSILPGEQDAAIRSNMWMPGALILVAIVLSSKVRQYHAFAGDILFIGGIVATITFSMIFSKNPSIVVLYFIPILFASVLFNRLGLMIVVSITGVILLGVSIFSAGFPFHTLVSPLATLGMATSAVWVSTYNLQETLAWTITGYQQARKNELLVREQKLILEHTLQRLDATIDQLQHSNTMLVDARNKAEEAQRLKQQFAQTISHELRTPLNLIVGFTETMIKSPEYYDKPLSPAYLRDLSVVYRNANHLQNLVNDVLDLARLEKASIMLVTEPLHIETVIEDAAHTVRGLVDKQGLHLRVELQPNLPLISGDTVRLKQILLNLLNNAIRFTEQGQITVRAFAQSNEVCVCVEDTGTGIPADRQHAIFEPFLQLENPMQRRKNGAGLGLAISKHLVELHGGHIYVESEPNHGSHFYFTLPVYLPDTLEVDHFLKEETEIATQNVITGRPSLLIITASPSAATLLSRNLADYRPVIVSNIHQIQSLTEKTSLQRVVVDTNTISLTDEQRTQFIHTPSLKQASIIFCPLPSEDFMRRQLAVDGFVVKPISQENIQDLLHQIDLSVKRILIVDDNRDFVRLLDRLVVSNSHHLQIMHAFNGTQALSLARKNRFDLILLDLNLPDVDGLQLVHRLRQIAQSADLKIIIVSAYEMGVASTPLQGSISVCKPAGLFPNEILKFIQGAL